MRGQIQLTPPDIFGERRHRQMHASNKRACPHCRSLETSRSHRQGSVEPYFLRVIGVLPYRCLSCDARFYAYSRFGAGASVTDKTA
jgi:hypothetical protein